MSTTCDSNSTEKLEDDSELITFSPSLHKFSILRVFTCKAS